MKEIARGAEAVLYLDNNTLIKDRIKKDYRIDKIDKYLRATRTKKEAKLLEKSSKLIHVPKVIEYEEEKIFMEFIDGMLVRDALDVADKKQKKHILACIGEGIKKLHENSIIHGDLTTSNMILKDNKLYFIDFGLGLISEKIEDMAVDMHLLKQALFSKHHETAEDCFNEILKKYEPSKEFLKRFEKVEGRGRYKRKQIL